MRKRIRAIFGVFSILMLTLLGSCAPASTPDSNTPPQESTNPQIADVEKQAGFDVKEPTYLPPGVSFDTATYQSTPSPYVLLQFKITHEEYGDMGNFFQIMQEAQSEAPADVLSCGANAEGCEVFQVNNILVVYHQNPAGPEGLDWYADGVVYRLLRTAGEPNKDYKAELVKVVASME